MVLPLFFFLLFIPSFVQAASCAGVFYTADYRYIERTNSAYYTLIYPSGTGGPESVGVAVDEPAYGRQYYWVQHSPVSGWTVLGGGVVYIPDQSILTPYSIPAPDKYFKQDGASFDMSGVDVINYLNANFSDGCTQPCDFADDDGDGVCNQCDQLNGVPDKEDCLRGTSVNSAGETTAAFIDKGCQGQTGEWWKSDNFNSEDRFIANIGDSAENKGKLNCAQNCTQENPCEYGPSALGAIVGSMTSSSVPPSQTAQEIIDSLLDLPSPLDMPDRCDGHNQQCKEYCEDKLGVGMSYCYEKDGKKKSNCVCNNDFAYDMVTDSDTPSMEQADITKDSNNSGVPDYADDSILNQGDTDGDGITDKADVDQTGGQDSNGDGIDDAYTANAQAAANASAGLSKSDSLNLDSIATNTAQTSAATQGLKTGIDKIAENTGDLKEKADAALAESQAIRAKLDSFNEDGTASLATQQGQLVDGLFPGIQPGDIPSDPTEDFDVDSFVQEFSFAFPNEVKTIIEGSSVQVQNPDSCVQGEIMGQQVQFCFDRFQAIFLAMGLLFKGLCVWRAIEIIAVGVRA